MIAPLTAAETRTARRLFAIYTEATAHILAEELAAEASSVPTGADLVTARISNLTTPDTRAQFATYLDRLTATHGRDPAMAAYIRRSRALLAETAPSAPQIGPDHTPPADEEVAAHG